MTRGHDLAAFALRALDPEDAHRLAVAGLKLGLGPRPARASHPALASELAGLKLANPIGLAAGFDKNAEVPDAMLAAGFGFVECGTVTPRPQAGNPRPRLFRLSRQRAVINRLGFNNRGLDAFADRLAGRPRRGIVGANIGANKDSADRVADYVAGLTRLAGLADYVTVNVSSPNTPGLRDLQSGAALADLLAALASARDALTVEVRPPIFLKVAPELSAREAQDLAEAAVRFGLSGLIVSNTTLERPEGLQGPHRRQAGGLSGAPLMDASTRLLAQFHALAAGRLSLIGVGGVASGGDAYAKIRAGACAVQLYSALVFEGPGLVGDILDDLNARLLADGFTHVGQAVGAS